MFAGHSLPRRSFSVVPFSSSLSPYFVLIKFIMAKTTKGKAKSLKKSHVEPKPLHTGVKKTGRGCRKAATMTQQSASSDDELEEPATDTPNLTLKIPAHVVWDKYPERTERLLDYLDAHPDVATKLFGDATQATNLEGCSKLTAKSNKGTAYVQVADGIFSVNNNAAIRADFKTNLNKYVKVVDNYITNT